MLNKLRNFIVDRVYYISNSPIKLNNLLEANMLYNDGVLADGKKLGFRLKVGKAYLYFLLLANAILLPVALLLHNLFAKLDCHLSLLIVIIVTTGIMAFFKIYKDWLEEEVVKRVIKNSWDIHFAPFPYDEYNKKIDEIYKRALKEGVLKNDLEMFIMENIS